MSSCADVFPNVQSMNCINDSKLTWTTKKCCSYLNMGGAGHILASHFNDRRTNAHQWTSNERQQPLCGPKINYKGIK